MLKIPKRRPPFFQSKGAFKSIMKRNRLVAKGLAPTKAELAALCAEAVNQRNRRGQSDEPSPPSVVSLGLPTRPDPQ